MVQPLLRRRIQSGLLSFLGRSILKIGQGKSASLSKDWSLPKPASMLTAEAAEKQDSISMIPADANPDPGA